jgi:putative ABC transport system permease protein
MALAVMLLAGAGVMIRSFWNVHSADLGVRTDHVVTALLGLPKVRYPDAASQASFYDKLQARIEAIPGVESLAITERLPASGSRALPYELADAEPFGGERRPELSVIAVGPGYFETFDAAMRSGRAFHNADGVSGIPVVIVNQRFADANWPRENPLGKRLRMFDGEAPGAWRMVVGVAPNIIQNDFTRQEFNSMAYVPFREEWPRETWVVARTSMTPAGFAKALRREVQALDTDLPIWLGPFTLMQRLDGNDWSRRINGMLFLVFAAIALMLASGGLYAVIAHSVSQRTREIGVRMAIGGTAGDIRKLVLRQGLPPLGGGLVLGVAASFALNRVLESQLVGVSPTDLTTLIGASAVLILAATMGCLIPARRAVRVDPLTALRHD